MFTLQHKVHAVSFAIAFDNLNEAMRRFQEWFDLPPPSASQIRYWKEKLLETGTLVKNREGAGRPVSASGDGNKEAVRNLINESPTISTRELSRATHVSQTSIRRIIKKEGFRPWKLSIHQELYDADPDRRIEFCEGVMRLTEQRPDFYTQIVFSDEATFTLQGTVNKHNLHYYSREKPDTYLPQPVNSVSLKVWIMMNGEGVKGLHITQQTINGEYYYREILESIVWPYFRHRRLKVFQQDGAPPHYYGRCRQFLDERLNERWIGRRGSLMEFPPRSPDLTPLDYWLWSYLKDNVYKTKQANIQQLEESIRTSIEDIPLQFFSNAIAAFPKRIQRCIEVGGGIFE